MAGLASNVPDWDGLPMLVDMRRFEAGHRVWGHNLLAILVSSFVLGWTQAQFHWIESIGNRVRQRFSLAPPEPLPALPVVCATIIFSVIAGCSQLIHLPCDMVVSGGEGLTDWLVKPFWPFSNVGYVFPLIPWGDIGPTVILMTGAIAIARRSSHASAIAVGTLAILCLYLIGRGWYRGML
jgi:membrane-bound metal-dependent hydrolase YbcI (DUF457 family)